MFYHDVASGPMTLLRMKTRPTTVSTPNCTQFKLYLKNVINVTYPEHGSLFMKSIMRARLSLLDATRKHCADRTA